MDIKFSHAWTALDKLRDEIGIDNMKDTKLEISVTEDDPGSGRMVACMLIKCSKVSNPGTYDYYGTQITQEYTVEVFSESENRAPRLTMVQTRDLEKKR